jgi:hypothetical protein
MRLPSGYATPRSRCRQRERNTYCPDKELPLTTGVRASQRTLLFRHARDRETSTWPVLGRLGKRNGERSALESVKELYAVTADILRVCLNWHLRELLLMTGEQSDGWIVCRECTVMPLFKASAFLAARDERPTYTCETPGCQYCS